MQDLLEVLQRLRGARAPGHRHDVHGLPTPGEGSRRQVPVPALFPHGLHPGRDRLVRALLAPKATGPAPRTCPSCGRATNRLSNGLCSRCWQANPDRPVTAAANLAARLDEIPYWYGDLVAHVITVHCPGRAAVLISALGRLLTDDQPNHPQALLERSRRPGRSMGSLARALEHHFTSRGLALPTDQQQRLAAGRRDRRVQAVPTELRPAVARYAEALVANQVRARRAGTKPRSDSTIDGSLAILRDLAKHLHQHGVTDWSSVTISNIEDYLSSLTRRNSDRPLTATRMFFAWAKRNRIVLVNPTKPIPVRPRAGFSGAALTLARQRALFTRWTTGDAQPNEALVGLLALLHAATNSEARGLKVTDANHADQTLQLGDRPSPTPIDPATWAALQRCLDHRQATNTANPHVLITRSTKMDSRPASTAYLSHVLDPAGVACRTLRVTRIAELVNTMDPKLVAAVTGMSPESVLPYLADHVDPGRIPEELANLSTFGAT